ncbi:TPA: baseplate assembly protein [Enterobacter cloacae]|nr:baseplate assembly protein [Enterobacter cloacae]
MAVIDLSQLPAPQIVDMPDFETLLAERKAAFVALYPADEQAAVARTLALESEPITKQLQESTYREVLLRQRINEAAQAVMVAYALGGDLEQLAANYNVKRLTVTPADNDAVPPVAAVMESDEALRLRVPAAFEGLSVAGPTAAYEFHARSADGRVADASATSPAPAEVVLTVLSREGDGTAENDLLAVVEKALNSESVRPVADRLTVRSAEIIPYSVDATIFIYPGPEAEPVMAAAKSSLQKHIVSQTRLGRDIRRSALYAALHVEGVQRVELASPLADVVLDKTQAASCTQWNVTNGGTDE